MLSKKSSHSRYHSIQRVMCDNCHKVPAHYCITSLPFDTLDANKKDELSVCFRCLEQLINVWYEIGDSFEVPLLRLDNYTETKVCCLPKNKAVVASRILEMKEES